MKTYIAFAFFLFASFGLFLGHSPALGAKETSNPAMAPAEAAPAEAPAPAAAPAVARPVPKCEVCGYQEKCTGEDCSKLCKTACVADGVSNPECYTPDQTACTPKKAPAKTQ